MRSNNGYRNRSNISRMVIKEENDDDEIIEINMSRDSNNRYPSSIPRIQLPKSSIIGTDLGELN
jgi:hypothetical protein